MEAQLKAPILPQQLMAQGHQVAAFRMTEVFRSAQHFPFEPPDLRLDVLPGRVNTPGSGPKTEIGRAVSTLAVRFMFGLPNPF